MTNSTPSRAQGGPSSTSTNPSSRRGAREGPSASGSRTPAGTSERTPRTPRRAGAASAPSTSARPRAQRAESDSDSAQATIPIFTSSTPASWSRPDRFNHGRAPSPESPRSGHRAQADIYSEEEEEEFPETPWDPASWSPTKITRKGWKSPTKLEKERKEREKQMERQKRRAENLRRKKQAVPPANTEVIEIQSSDEEPPSPTKRKRPPKQDSPRKRSRTEPVIYIISSGDEADAPVPATRPAPVEDVEDVSMGFDDSNVDGMAGMALDDPVPLDHGVTEDEAAHLPARDADITNVGVTSDPGEPMASGGEDSTAAESVAGANAFDEMPWTAGQIEDARLFDEALASVAREELESEDAAGLPPAAGDATLPAPPAAVDVQAPEQAALHGPGVPSSPFPSSSTASIVSTVISTHRPTPPPGPPPGAKPSPPPQSTAAPPSPVPSSIQPQTPPPPFSSGTKPSRATAAPPSSIGPSPPPSVTRPHRPPQWAEAFKRPVPPSHSKVPTRQLLYMGTHYDGNTPTPIPLKPACTVVPYAGVGLATREVCVPMRGPSPSEVVNLSEGGVRPPVRDVSVPMRAVEPELAAPQVATTKANTCSGYSPPPVSPTSDSTLGTPSIGTNVVLAAAGASLMKQVNIMLSDEDDDDDDSLQLGYPSP